MLYGLSVKNRWSTPFPLSVDEFAFQETVDSSISHTSSDCIWKMLCCTCAVPIRHWHGVMFTSQPIGSDQYPRLLRSHLTWEWMLVVPFPTDDKSQILVSVSRFFVQWQRGYFYHTPSLSKGKQCRNIFLHLHEPQTAPTVNPFV